MPRPTTKTDLIAAANKEWATLWKTIDSMSDDVKFADFSFDEDFLEKNTEAHWKRDKNLRDVIAHLLEWHLLMIDWANSNRSGVAKPFLPAPYNWKSYGEMNVEFWKKHQSSDYTDVKSQLFETHKTVLELAESFSDTELFEKKHFDWTGTSMLGSYFISNTSSHYAWATKKLKRHIKNNS